MTRMVLGRLPASNEYLLRSLGLPLNYLVLRQIIMMIERILVVLADVTHVGLPVVMWLVVILLLLEPLLLPLLLKCHECCSLPCVRGRDRVGHRIKVSVRGLLGHDPVDTTVAVGLMLLLLLLMGRRRRIGRLGDESALHTSSPSPRPYNVRSSESLKERKGGARKTIWANGSWEIGGKSRSAGNELNGQDASFSQSTNAEEEEEATLPIPTFGISNADFPKKQHLSAVLNQATVERM